ncbi:MAG: pyrimidine/purine nucleoside phosphorylase [Verrucomicrobia bacterium]|nr:pyrimidine/purine nucleoside phosphorylase [Verrucomicrobiota bacterium]MCH8513164.1 pyrimidine/purine nucleoside phosphorylase [Kiritimatiellia bacterium]
MFNTNSYYEGKVVSLGFDTPEATATVGVMAPGTYEFSTSAREVMTVVTGELIVKLPGASDWNTYGPGMSFEVAADQRFGVRVTTNTAYLCLYGG